MAGGTKTGVFHQNPGVAITQGVCVCLYMCGTACLGSPALVKI